MNNRTVDACIVSNKQTNRQIMKLHWGNAITIFFVIFLSLAIYFIFFALRQNKDLVSDNYYNKGAEYTKQIYINERSDFFKDSLVIDTDENNLIFLFCDSITNYTNTVFVDFYRPSGKRFDYKVKFETNLTLFLVDKSKLENGRYIVTMSWKMNKLDYEITKDIFIE